VTTAIPSCGGIKSFVVTQFAKTLVGLTLGSALPAIWPQN
jgi:hypothetical protein